MDIEQKEAIIDAFEEVTQQGGHGNFLIINIDEEKTYYIQFSTEKDSGDIYAEVVSNAFIPGPYQLTDAKLKLLQEAGWSAPEHEMANFSRSYSFEPEAIDFDLLCEHIDYVASQIFETELPDELELTVNLE